MFTDANYYLSPVAQSFQTIITAVPMTTTTIAPAPVISISTTSAAVGNSTPIEIYPNTSALVKSHSNSI